MRWISDDAFISLRYAKNFADGKGLVFNEGEFEKKKVEEENKTDKKRRNR